MKLKLPENPPRPPDGYYWDDEDGDINLREEGKSPDNLDEAPRNWPKIYTDSLEEAMNWLVAAVILGIRKEGNE